jgi:predicted nucleic acid-binding protein
MGTLALDTTILSNFATADRLDILSKLLADHDCVTTKEVIHELTRGLLNHPALANALSLPWVKIVALETLEVVRFASYKAELGGNDTQNMGESSILDWAGNPMLRLLSMIEQAPTSLSEKESSVAAR